MKLTILGTGKIIDEVLPVLREINGIELSAILSTPRSPERTQKLAETYSISQAGSDYGSILVNSDVDTVYMALPSRLYYDYVKRALLARRRVTCEKSFTLTLAKFEDLARIAEQNNRILLEAITNQYPGNFAAVKGDLTKLDDIRIVECNYSQYSSRHGAFKRGEIVPAFGPEKGGGALRDLDIYNIHLVIGLSGRPEKVQYLANMERGVDTSGILTMDYGHFRAACIGTKDCVAKTKSTIQGNKGSITTIGTTNTSPELALSLNNQNMAMINENTLSHHMRDEFIAFQAIIEQEDVTATRSALEHSHTVMEVLDAAVNSL